MAKVKLRQEMQRAVTARFPLSDFAELVQEAESKGTTVAGVLRQAWTSHKEQTDVKQILSRMESRFFRHVFDVCTATAGLDETERKEVMADLKARRAIQGGGK